MVLVDVTKEVFAHVSEKMGRPYELEGDRIAAVVAAVQSAKRDKDYEKAIAILLPQLDLWEKDAAAGLGGVAPWYYEQAAIIYRKLGRLDDEIAVLERFSRQQHAPGVSPPQLLDRLERAKMRRAGIKPPPRPKPVNIAPQPPFIDTEKLSATSFMALDIETANFDCTSICSIGLAHFRDGRFFKSLTILVDPKAEFHPMNISVHGIRPGDVKGKPTITEVLSTIGPWLKDMVVVHHSPFDRTSLLRVIEQHNIQQISCAWLDTIRVARRAWPHFSTSGGFGLARLASEFDIQFKHHDAEDDARAAGHVMQRAINDTGLNVVDWLGRVEQAVRSPTSKR